MKRSETEPMAYGFLAGAAFLLFSLLVMQWGCASTPHAENTPSIEPPPVSKMVMSRDGKDAGQCTAWKAGDDLAVTAGHCCEADYSYVFTDGVGLTGSPTKLLIDDDEHDICVLRAWMKDDPLPLALSDPDVGDYVWTAGYPAGYYLISAGYWSGRDKDGQGISSVVAVGGASGSPVMNADGYVIGVLVAGLRYSSDNVTFTAPLEWLRIALERAR